jgi:hypothetical protein
MITTCSKTAWWSGEFMKTTDAPEGTPWRWTLLFEYHDDRAQTLCYEKTREAAMAVFRKVGGGNDTVQMEGLALPLGSLAATS